MTKRKSRQKWVKSLLTLGLMALGRREEAAVTVSRSVPGLTSRDELALLYRTARDLKLPGNIAEVGSWKGRTAVTMGRAVHDKGAKRRIYCIDPHMAGEDDEPSTLETFRLSVSSRGVKDLVEEMVMTSAEAARIIGERGEKLAMVFIDGLHEEEAVRHDIRAFLPLVAAGGVIALHDCVPDGAFPGVWKAYQSELFGKVVEIARASSLVVTLVRNPAES